MWNLRVILVVDDYRDGGQVLSHILRAKGYPATWVSGGREAIAFLLTHPPEQPILLILDDMMPEPSGMQTLEMIRADPRISRTPVIMHSAGFDLAHRDQAMTLGAVAWLLKGGSAGASVDAVIETIIEWYRKVGGAPLRDDAAIQSKPKQ
jgi:CheY-like chemotaxis protein